MDPKGNERDDAITVAATGIAAYIIADVVHECLGHGVMCFLTGGKITLLTSVFFRSEPLSRLTDIAGPSANLIVGVLALIGLRLSERLSAQTRFFLLLSMAFNLFWGSGYLIYSGVANTGDWASAIVGLQPLWFWRLVLVVLGVVLYAWSIRMVAASLRSFLGRQGNHRVQRLLFIPYLAAGLAACFAALFYPDDRIGSLSGAAREAFLTNIGLLLILPRFRVRRADVVSTANTITRNLSWIVITAIVLVIFAAIMGRGLRFQY